MKKLLILTLCGFLLNCSNDDSNEDDDNANPINAFIANYEGTVWVRDTGDDFNWNYFLFRNNITQPIDIYQENRPNDCWNFVIPYPINGYDLQILDSSENTLILQAQIVSSSTQDLKARYTLTVNGNTLEEKEEYIDNGTIVSTYFKYFELITINLENLTSC